MVRSISNPLSHSTGPVFWISIKCSWFAMITLSRLVDLDKGFRRVTAHHDDYRSVRDPVLSDLPPTAGVECADIRDLLPGILPLSQQ